jgi:hypothetical protein
VGVVEVRLFVGMADAVYFGNEGKINPWDVIGTNCRWEYECTQEGGEGGETDFTRVRCM